MGSLLRHLNAGAELPACGARNARIFAGSPARVTCPDCAGRLEAGDERADLGAERAPRAARKPSRKRPRKKT